MHFLVIGGDAAGMSAASRAKRNQPEINVTVLEETMDVSYSACGMPYNIADPDRDIDDLVVRQAQVFREKQGIDLKTGCRAEAIDPEAKTVQAKDHNSQKQQFSYDYLLIATGASPVMPEIPGIDQKGVLPLKRLSDGRSIKDYLAGNRTESAILVGMGYIGLEMAEALSLRGIHVTGVTRGFMRNYDSSIAEVVQQTLAQHNVNLYRDQRVEKIEKRGSSLAVVCNDRDLEAGMVLMGLGVAPNSRIAGDAGIALGPKQAISVSRKMQTSNPFIYSAGDCADAYHVVSGQKTWVPLALLANRGGWAAADNICGKPVEVQGIAGSAVFKTFELEVARTGLSTGEAEAAGFEPASVTIDARSRAHAHPGAESIRVHMVGDKKSGRLLGAQMVGKEGVAHRIKAPAVALHAQMRVEDFGQTDLPYAPPFSPVWDPLLTAANQLMKKL
ncbi:MAG: FAD-dependent oxidoreductase [Desulfobacteraceae bacterium]|nr:FAD-dependent oxidoreductase [Desulfobacteraceae bacterium]